MSTGHTALLKFSTTDVEVLSVKAADVEARHMPLAIDPGASTGIGGVQTGDEASAAIYDIQGRRLDGSAHLPKGIYIKGGHKVVIK